MSKSGVRFYANLFDLDGTLTDSQEGIKKCFEYALDKLGLVEYKQRDMSKFIGPPLYQSLKNLGLPEETVMEGIKYYRERYSTVGMYENTVYPGIESLLKELHERGAYLAVATTKAEVYARVILEHFKLDKYFAKIIGPSLADTNEAKKELIQKALPDKYESAVMIGDRYYDIDGAKAVGIQSVGVLYGFGELSEMEEHSAGKIVATVEELRDYLIM